MSLVVSDSQDPEALRLQLRYHREQARFHRAQSRQYFRDSVKLWVREQIDAVKEVSRYHTSMLYRHRSFLGNRLATYGGWGFGISQTIVTLMMVNGVIH